jgi:hypothetical protein
MKRRRAEREREGSTTIARTLRTASKCGADKMDGGEIAEVVNGGGGGNYREIFVRRRFRPEPRRIALIGG